MLFLLHNEETIFIGTENIVIPPIDTILDQLDVIHSGVTAGTSFFKTMAGKVTMAVAGIVVLGGIGTGIFLNARNNPHTRMVPKEAVNQVAEATEAASAAPPASLKKVFSSRDLPARFIPIIPQRRGHTK